jgi:hypothetical protein
MGKKKIARQLAALREEVEVLKKEMATLRADQKAKFKDEIRAGRTTVRQAKRGFKRKEKKAEGKVQALGEKAAKAKREAKVAVEARIANIRKGLKKPTTTTNTTTTTPQVS